MLRIIFWILLIANGALFAFHQGYFDSSHEKKEPQRLLAQFNADKLKLLPASAANAAPPEAPPVLPAPAVEPQKTVSCLEIGNFSSSDAKRFEERLVPLSLEQKPPRLKVEEVASHMVYIPPLGSKEAAEKKVAELRKLGVENFFIMQDGSGYRWGISLGVFKTAQAAKNQLADLNKLGVRGARIGTRSIASDKVFYRLRNLNTDSAQALDKIMSDFPEQKQRECHKE
jgi:hypothetical protein